ncbi:hypothetical protein V6N13_055543 [Hibiscus sabdariffa]|uniref:Uncharacterized protein n=1 Tax=Hibiscus sabdariffa TaxID=183260 RepID=A0ABR2BND9_9ROSI
MDKNKEAGRRKRTERAWKCQVWALSMRLGSDKMVRRPMFDGGGGGAAMAGGGRDDCGRPNERLLSLYYTVFSWKNWL